MYSTKYLLPLLALSVHLASSWDIAVTFQKQIEFYENGKEKYSEGLQFNQLSALAYDAVSNVLLFANNNQLNTSIWIYSLTNKTFLPPIKTGLKHNILGIAFDPFTETVFWTDALERNVFSISLKEGGEVKKLLNNTNGEIPFAVAVDSCRGYVYWTNTNFLSATIERARFDGSDIETVINTDIYMPNGLAIDQKANKLYWVNKKAGIHFTIESLDVESGQRTKLLENTEHQPVALTISKDYIYWIDVGFKTIWKLSRDSKEANVAKYFSFTLNDKPSGIVTNYSISDQFAGVAECEDLLKKSKKYVFELAEPNTLLVDSTKNANLIKSSNCTCPVPKINLTKRSSCENYCLRGQCSLSNGKPHCRCIEGYSGARCEVLLCYNYCFNDGVCSSKDQRPSCTCSVGFEGERCERQKITTKDMDNNTSEITRSPVTRSASNGEYTIDRCSNDWDSLRDPILLAFGIICGLLIISCSILIFKIQRMKKMPRLKKRFIVNKNVTPLTARPDQCEITIENCCNMNICETPCFEPRTTIRANLIDSKPGKEEKKNLIDNMEHSDDLLF